MRGARRRGGRMRRFGVCGLIIALLVSGCSFDFLRVGSAGDGRGLDGEIPIGAVWSLTGTGAAFGPQQRNGAALAVQAVNGSGFLGDASLKLLVEDDQTDPRAAAAAFERLVDHQRVVAILGPTLSTSARLAHPVAQAKRVPALAVSNTADGIVEVGEFVFRNSLPESVVQPNMIRVTHTKLGYERAAIFYTPDDAFTASGYRAFVQALEANGVQIVAIEPVSIGQTDFTRQLTAIQALQPDAIVLSTLTAEAAAIMRQARQLGLFPDVQFLGGNSLNSPQFLQLAGSAANGAVSGVSWALGAPTPRNRAFGRAYRELYGADPDQFAAQAYAGVYLLATAIKQARTSDPRAIRDALARLRNVDTVLGKFSFDETREPILVPMVQVIRDGQPDLFP